LHLAGWVVDVPDIPAETGAYVVRLRDSWGEVRWEPGDPEEMSGAGRVFAAVVRCLYDGRNWQACIMPAICASMDSQDLTFSGTDEEEAEHLRDEERRVLRRLGLTRAFAVRPEEVGEDESLSLPVDYWWCPKQRLADALAESWWVGFEGYIAPRNRASLIHSCFSPDPTETVRCLLSQCRLVFQAIGEEEQLLVLSRSVSLDELNGALSCGPVRRALDELTKVARFTEWETVDRGPGWRLEQKK
jgi:hypothetical protein